MVESAEASRSALIVTRTRTALKAYSARKLRAGLLRTLAPSLEPVIRSAKRTLSVWLEHTVGTLLPRTCRRRKNDLRKVEQSSQASSACHTTLTLLRLISAGRLLLAILIGRVLFTMT